MGILKIDQENQETIQSLWVIFCTGYVFYILYRLYHKYPKIFNPDYKKQLAFKEKEKITIKNIQNNLSNNLKKINEINISKIEEQIKINEKKIIAFDRKYLQDLIRLTNYVKDTKGIIESRISEIEGNFNSYDYGQIVRELSHLNRNLKDLYAITFSMIECLVNEDLTEYHTIYEKLDRLGIFESNFEKQLSRNLNAISSELDGIKSSLNYTNTLLTYNTYQLNSISGDVNKLNKESKEIKKDVGDIKKDVNDLKKRI